MRSGLSKSEFFLKCNRKPAQQALLDRIGTITLEEIENCGQPLWVRDALKELHKRGGQTAGQTAAVIADQMQANYVRAPDPTHPVYRYTGIEQTIVPPKGMSLDLLTNDYFICDTARNEMKVEYSVLRMERAKMLEIMSSSQLIGLMTDRQYIEFIAQEKQRT